ncbi:MAG: riboflavin synthase [Chitinophagales bacterium]|nr:riboflavin synthase [Chitinophagales bacterium]
MFTGIIEALGIVKSITTDSGNLRLVISSPISKELKIDQSVNHNGACLTVVACDDTSHEVVAISETLRKTNLAELKEGDLVNLERCMPVNGRYDGHIVTGHVDQVGRCVSVVEDKGSWLYQFEYQPGPDCLIVEKGSICINGISLTAFDVFDDVFKVAIIPYTFTHTNIQYVRENSTVNLEFDIIGKYISRLFERGYSRFNPLS